MTQAKFLFATLAVAAVGFSSQAQASRSNTLRAIPKDDAVKITSFGLVFPNMARLAELCGKVTGTSSHYDVRVVVDYNSGDPGTYNTAAGQDGNFCVLVNTYEGQAEVFLDKSGVK